MDRRAVERLQSVNDFDSLLPYLRDELDWPVEDYGFDDLTFQYTAQELGLDDQSAANVTAIRRLRPLDDEQPWGIFFLELEPKRLPVVALRRLLSKMTLKKRASSNRSDSPAWHADDILLISRTGDSDERHLTFAHFAANPEKADLPVLKVLGWDASDTVLRVDHVAEVLKEKLVWPADPSDSDLWRKQWRDAFTLKHRQQVTTAKEMASRLAELARGIRGAIREVLAVESENGPLTKIMDAFRESLVHDLDPEQFADTYAQTITYGLLSARITDPTKNTLDDLASHMQTNPFLKELMESFIHVGGRKKSEKGVGLDFDELGVSDVIELLDNANMEAVVRDFGKHNQQEDPVIHFFEGFLQEYDKSIRKDRGVFYTPRPVVSFIVRSVDELLRTEFGLEDGLADISTWGDMVARIDDLEIPEGATPDQAFVQILDPATGTGTFLVEVIDLIHETMAAKWQAEGHGKKKIEKLWNEYVPEHLLPRLHGYELMMAPYAIAHMKIGLKLYETGYRFESDERARVYLTNALEPAHDFSGTLAFAIPALANEAEAVNAIKRDQRFTVVVGNPPYSYMSANLGGEVGHLIEPFRYVDGDRIKERSALSLERSLQDDFVKFFGLALKLRWQAGGLFVLGLITNNSYMDSPLHRGVRCELARGFSRINLVNLFGDGIKDKEENVFDIVQGVAVFLGRAIQNQNESAIYLTDLHGSRAEKYEALYALDRRHHFGRREIQLAPPQRYFLHLEQSGEYPSYPSLNEVFSLTSTCIKTLKDRLATGESAEDVRSKVEYFRDPENSKQALIEKFNVQDAVQWKIERARSNVRGLELDEFLLPYQARPFDDRWMFYHESIVGSPRRAVMQNLLGADNIALIVNRKIRTGQCHHFWITSKICVSEVISSADNSNCFPLYIIPEDCGLTLESTSRHNFTPEFLMRLSTTMGMPQASDGIPEGVTGEDIFHYTYAVMHSPSYRQRYADFLRIDFPRLPLAHDFALFQGLAERGRELVKLHLMRSPTLERSLTNFVGLGNSVVEKVSYANDTVWIDKAQTCGFEGVPEEVWNFQIGSYQVCEKWLKDRQAKGGENPRPGRVLTDEDIEHYQKIVVALAETIRIMAEIDEVIEAHGGWPGAFQKGDAGDEPVSDVVYAEADDGATQLDMVAEPKDG